MGALAIEELSQEIRAELLGGLPRVPDHGALACPARLWLEMPRPAVLRLHVPGVPGVVSIDGTDGLVFDADEWAALVEGVAADRVWPGSGPCPWVSCSSAWARSCCRSTELPQTGPRSSTRSLPTPSRPRRLR